MPKTIKTRNTVKNITVLDKSVNASRRVKNAAIRTEDKAGDTQNTHHATPTDYASDNIQVAARGVAHKTVHGIPNSRQNAHENWNRAKGFFQQIRRNTPKERNRAAEHAQKTAQHAKANADTMRNTAEQAKVTAQNAKTVVTDAKQTLRQAKQSNRQTLREVKQSARVERDVTSPRGSTAVQNVPKTAAASPTGKAVNPTAVSTPKGVASPPSYMSGKVTAPRGMANLGKPPQTTVQSVESTRKRLRQTAKGTVKTAKKSIKTAETSAKTAVKTAKQTAKAAQTTAHAAVRTAKAAEHAARAAAKAAARSTKVATKAVTAMAKATIAALRGLVAAIAAGGSVAVLIILLICLIGLMVSSVFGIFFSSEPSPDTGQTINSVIAEIDTEYTAQIDDIIAANAHDSLDMSGARAGWKEVLAVYTVKTVTDPDNPMEVATVDDTKAALLRSVFWEMNEISYTLDTTSVVLDVIGDDGLPTGETTTQTTTVLRIVVTHKTPDEMAVQYGFSDEQTTWLAELLKPKYHSLWNTLLYGIAEIGDGSMIATAETQLGNIGGETYWRWYGFDSHVEWCAIFVSWVAEQCGYIDAGIVPKFASCAVGIQWFRDCGQWQGNTFTPRPGDLVFFDWEPDGACDHVGIVESVENGRVNTIEGNSSDSVARRSYDLGSAKIFGYGVLAL